MKRIFLILLLLLPNVVFATSGTTLEIDHNETLSGQILSYQNIHIHNGVTLTLEPGSDIHFLPGGTLYGEGSLQVLGTAENPVYFEGGPWVNIDLEGDVTLSWLTIVGAEGPFMFRGKTNLLDHVTFRDSERSELYFGKTEAVIDLHDISILWDTAPISQRQIGIYISGPVEQIDISNITLPRKVELSEQQLIDIKNGYRYLSTENIHTVDGCPLVGRGRAPDFWQFFMNGNCSTEEPSLLFIPGYGASINLPFLNTAKPQASQLEGWHLIPLLTNSYKLFLDEASKRGIKSAIAYYDWRQNLSDIVHDYLIPAIDDLKRRDSITKVYLVAHSFGGLVARYYIQSPQYRGDIAGLVEMGTPNRGSPKAYGPWEGGVFPSDWQPVQNVIRGYVYQSNEVGSELEALRTFIPSGRDLLPIDPILQRPNGLKQSITDQKNTELQELNDSGKLLIERVPLLFTVAGVGLPTTNLLRVSEPKSHAFYWPDGEVQPAGEVSTAGGDGTVPLVSAGLNRVSQILVAAAHQDIPSVAASAVLNLLYPNHVHQDPPPLQGAARATANLLWFTFDCPVTVTITSPSGKTVTSTEPALTETSAVLTDPQAIWILLQKESGAYHITITALAATEVRWWQGNESIHIYTLKNGEVRQVLYSTQSESLVSQPVVIQPYVEEDPFSISPQAAFSFSPFSLSQRMAAGFNPLLFVTPKSITTPQIKSEHQEPAHLAYILVGLPILLLLRKKREPPQRPHHPP